MSTCERAPIFKTNITNLQLIIIMQIDEIIKVSLNMT